jgi:hypothetical protein
MRICLFAKTLSVPRAFILTITLALAAGIGYAQLTRGFISGTLQDPSGAVIPNADVKIVQKSTGFERKTATNAEGLLPLCGSGQRRLFDRVLQKRFPGHSR